MREFWAYLLRCSDGSYYTGHTDNLEFRLAQHRAGIASDWTRRRLPVELVWQQSFPTRDEAKAAEFRIKPWARAKKEALIAGDWDLLSYFARPPKNVPRLRSGRTNRLGG
jgi:predicted GIY-YIG superfamily endonuclease